MKQYVIVTGASRGIGRAIALEFAEHGKNVIILSKKSKEDLENVRKIILNKNVSCFSFLTDVSDYNSVLELYNNLEKENIVIEGIINNAGISLFGLLQDLTIEEWNQIIATNLSSVFFMCKTFLDDMIKRQHGKIINISSVFGTVGASCEVAYSTTKGGINSFTKALAKEVAPSKIQVNAIACGAIDTSMNSRLNEEEFRALEEEIPIGRMGTTKEVAQLVYQVFCSNEYLTGQIITMDGGWM